MIYPMSQFRDKRESVGVFVKITSVIIDLKSELRYDLSLFISGCCSTLGTKAYQSDGNKLSVFDILRSLELLKNMFRFGGLFIKLVTPEKHGHTDELICDNGCDLVRTLLQSFHGAVSKFLFHYQKLTDGPVQNVSIKFFGSDLKNTISFTDDWLPMISSMNQMNVALEGIVCQPTVLATLIDMPFTKLSIKVTLVDRLRFMQNLSIPKEDRVRTAIPDGLKMLEQFFVMCLESKTEGKHLRKFRIAISCDATMKTEIDLMLIRTAESRNLVVNNFGDIDWLKDTSCSFENDTAMIHWKWTGAELTLNVELIPVDPFQWDERYQVPPPQTDFRLTLQKAFANPKKKIQSCNCVLYAEKL